MYCAKCGTELENGSYKCTNCGWTWEEIENKPAETDESTTIYNEETEADENNADATVELSDDAEPYTQNGIGSNPISDKINLASLYAKTHSKKIKNITLIILALVAVFILGIVIYTNSDSYKITKATELISEGKLSEGLLEIEDVYTPQANAIKKFVEIEEAKNTFVDSATGSYDAYSYPDADTISENMEKTLEVYNEFKTTIDEFNEENDVYYLPNQLRKLYECYNSAFNYVSEYIGISEETQGEISLALYDVQTVMMNDIYENKSSKNGDTFTLNQLQNRVDISKSALEILKDLNFSEIEVEDATVVSHCNTSPTVSEQGYDIEIIQTSTLLTETIDSLIYNCEYEIEDCQESINKDLKEFDLDDKLYKVHPIDGTTQYVGSNLKEITSYTEISQNRDTIINILKRDMLYYLIVGYVIG